MLKLLALLTDEAALLRFLRYKCIPDLPLTNVDYHLGKLFFTLVRISSSYTCRESVDP